MNSLKNCEPLCCWAGASWASLSQSYYSAANFGARLNKLHYSEVSTFVRVPYWLTAFPNMGEAQIGRVVPWTIPALPCSTDLSVWTTFIRAKHMQAVLIMVIKNPILNQGIYPKNFTGKIISSYLAKKKKASSTISPQHTKPYNFINYIFQQLFSGYHIERPS